MCRQDGCHRTLTCACDKRCRPRALLFSLVCASAEAGTAVETAAPDPWARAAEAENLPWQHTQHTMGQWGYAGGFCAGGPIARERAEVNNGGGSGDASQEGEYQKTSPRRLLAPATVHYGVGSSLREEAGFSGGRRACRRAGPE